MQIQDVVKLLQAAIEASLYVAPRDFGLTFAELVEVGGRLGLKEGEITDALGYPKALAFTGQPRRLTLPDHLWNHYGMLVFGDEPELRNSTAFDFVVKPRGPQRLGPGSAFTTQRLANVLASISPTVPLSSS